MTRPSSELLIVGHGNAITSLAFSADGKTLVSGSYDNTAIVWDVDSGSMQRRLQCRDFVHGVTITPDGNTIFTDDGQVWAATGRLLRRSRRRSVPLVCSPDGQMLAGATFIPGSDDYHVLLTDVRTGRTLNHFRCSENRPYSLAFSFDGEYVAACGYDSQESVTTVYNRRTGELRSVLNGEGLILFGANLGTDGRLVGASLDNSQRWNLWNVETGAVLKTIADLSHQEDAFYMCVALSSDGRLLAVGMQTGIVCVWNARTSRLLWQTEAHLGWLRVLTFTPDGKTLATAGDDHAIRLWNALDGKQIHTLGGRGSSVEAVAFTEDGETITAISKIGTAWSWRIDPPSLNMLARNYTGLPALGAPPKPDTARNLWSMDTASLPATADIPDGFTLASVSPDGSLVALKNPYGDIFVWNRSRQTVQCLIPGAGAGLANPTFSPDNRYLATFSYVEYGIRLFDTETGKIWKTFIIDGADLKEPCEFAFSKDSRLLAVGHTSFAVTLWNVATGKHKRTLWLPRDGISALAFSPDAKMLVIGTAYEPMVYLRSLTRGKKNVTLVGHTDSIRSAEFSPDGTRIATGAQDGAVRLWDVEAGKLLVTFQTLPEDQWVIYTPEGDYNCSPGAKAFFLRRHGDQIVPVSQ